MLPRPHRLHRSADFSATVRAGRRAGRRTLVVHLRHLAPDGHGSPAPRVGFVVGRAVGPAVTRNRVRRRLQHLAADRMSTLPAYTDLVVRALPPAATVDFTELGRDLDSCLHRLAGGPGGVAS